MATAFLQKAIVHSHLFEKKRVILKPKLKPTYFDLAYNNEQVFSTIDAVQDHARHC